MQAGSTQHAACNSPTAAFPSTFCGEAAVGETHNGQAPRLKHSVDLPEHLQRLGKVVHAYCTCKRCPEPCEPPSMPGQEPLAEGHSASSYTAICSTLQPDATIRQKLLVTWPLRHKGGTLRLGQFAGASNRSCKEHSNTISKSPELSQGISVRQPPTKWSPVRLWTPPLTSVRHHIEAVLLVGQPWVLVQ